MDADAAVPASRPRDASRTRADLLRAARRRFTLMGYERTTMRAIAADAHVNVALINRYFGSKDGLFAAVLDESNALFDGSDEAGRPVEESASEVFASMLAGLNERDWSEYGGEHPIMLMLRNAGPDPVAERLRREGLLTAVGRLSRALRADRTETSEGAADLSSELVLSLFIGVVILRQLLPDETLATANEHLLNEEMLRIVRSISRCDD
ncbi:TetR/AcrR family transcriptional regulator [Streptomyces sp. NPDC057094]|uniref:TetR/AcrR family transcriptional regulator n=1 Tax=Streptomyces sp. NPDC057094 TaxID=3346018 RepID=UPI00362C1C01